MNDNQDDDELPSAAEVARMTDTPVGLSDKAARAVQRGGDDDMSDDQLVIAELAARAPGISVADLQQVFVAVRMEYGDDALAAIREGYVQFEARKPQ